MDFDPDPNFPGFVSILALAQPQYGSDIFFSSKEEFDSVLLTLHNFPAIQYRGSTEHLTYLLHSFLQFSMLKSLLLQRLLKSVALITIPSRPRQRQSKALILQVTSMRARGQRPRAYIGARLLARYFQLQWSLIII
jgi:hypothetical protein